MEELIREIGRPIDSPYDLPTPAGLPSDEERQHFMRVIGQYMEMLPPDALPR
jgi:hypothetical protein